MTAVQEPRMRVELPNRDLTLDDVAELAAADNTHRYELDDGILVIMPPADIEHNAIIMRLGVWFVSHGFPVERVLPNPGVRIAERTSGRSPDLLVLRRVVEGHTVWVGPADVALLVEIVSRGSERLDRLIKPGEYSRAGIARYWRIERDGGGATTVHMYELGSSDQGEPAYIEDRAVLLDKLLASAPPQL